MPNAKDAQDSATENILLVGPTGSGKTSQILTLPGKKFVYIFDPNALATLQGHDVEYGLFLPDVLEVDSTLKGFNKNAKKDDKPASAREPRVYMDWGEDFNGRVEKDYFKDFDWICFDSLTFFGKA